jgi:hypothetical protein
VAGKLPEIWDPSTGTVKKAGLFEVSGLRTEVPVNLEPFGSVFIIFRKAYGKNHIRKIQNLPEKMNPDFPPPEIIFDDEERHAFLITSQPGNYTLEKNNGEPLTFHIEDIPNPLALTGPWELIFPANQGVPERTSFNALISWTDHPDPAIRHFSGTAGYHTTFEIPEAVYGDNLNIMLDLGEVMNMAEVIVNGREMGILWKKPFRLDITGVAKPGENEILIRITNTWWNRLVGDEKYPKGYPGDDTDKPSSYTTHKAWNEQSELLPAGLIGPVRIFYEKEYRIW